MRIPIFAIVIAFVIWLNFVANRASRRDEDRKRAFWERENAANSVRKQSLDGLPYIHIPEDLLPADVTDSAFAAHEAAARIARLRENDACQAWKIKTFLHALLFRRQILLISTNILIVII